MVSQQVDRITNTTEKMRIKLQSYISWRKRDIFEDGELIIKNLKISLIFSHAGDQILAMNTYASLTFGSIRSQMGLFGHQNRSE